MDATQAFRFLTALADELMDTAKSTLGAGKEAETTDVLADATTILKASHVVDIYGAEVERALKIIA